MTDRLISMKNACWCGCDKARETPHPEYILCENCSTARVRSSIERRDERVTDDRCELYGVTYWDAHMREQGLPSIDVRARADLPERCIYWLQTILKYKLPPCRSLEIGCGHGGFVKMMNMAGFRSLGIEMSPSIIADSKERFGVPILQGPFEHAEIDLDTMDMVLLFDVLEHLHSPLETMAAVSRHLSEQAVVVIQTPLYKEDVPDSFRHHFLPLEHLHLFSSKGIEELLTRVGLKTIVFERALFPDDMFVFASRTAMPVNTSDMIDKVLQVSPESRIILALSDLYRENQELRRPLHAYGVSLLIKSLVRAFGLYIHKHAIYKEKLT